MGRFIGANVNYANATMLYSYHRGQYLQRGKGLGGIFKTLIKWIKPIIPKIVKFGRSIISDGDVKTGLSKVKKEAIEAGTRAINKELKKVAPLPKKQPPAKKKKKHTKVGEIPMLSPSPNHGSISVKKAKKKLQKTMKKTNHNAKSIFDEMK